MENKQARIFHFKQFSLFHHLSSMKVGTDAVLLGSWIEDERNENILDIGCGCGVLSLMMAVKCKNAKIFAIDIDSPSVAQSIDNFIMSDFASRLSVCNMDVKRYAKETNHIYDLIVSNPPYFNNSLKSGKQSRDRARHTDSLSFVDLADSAFRLLSDEGRFCVILPYSEGLDFIETAKNRGFYLRKLNSVTSREGKGVSRLLIELRKVQGKTISEELTIRDIKNSLTEDYKILTGDFYISFD